MALSIFLTDTHLSPVTEDINISIFNQVREEAKKLGLTNVYHLGDIFDARKAQPLQTLKTFEKILDDFAADGMVLIAIPGNHDKNDYKSENSYLDPFKHHPAFKLISTFEIIKLADNVRLICIPFFSENAVFSTYFDKAVSYIKKGQKCFLMTHIAVNGVKNNDGSKVENTLSKEMFSKFEQVFVGHYHNQSIIGKNINYIGSAFQHNFGEDENKGFCILHDDFEIEYIKAVFPKYKKIIVDLSKTSPKQTEQLIKEHKSENYKVRFVFKGSFEQVNAIDKNLFKKQGIDVKLESAELEAGIEEAEQDEFVSFDKTGIENEFEIFCTENKIEDKKTGKKYINQILNK